MGIADNFFKKAVAIPKATLVDIPKAVAKGSKMALWDAPNGIKKFAFSKKGLGIVALAMAGLAAIGGLASRSKRSVFENLQEQEATDLQASIAANRAARVQTSQEMGQGDALPYRNDWRAREKGGLPGQQTAP